MAKYTDEDKRRAYRAYHYTRTARGASDMCGIPLNAINTWKKKYDWDERILYEDQQAAEDFVEGTYDECLREIDDFCDQFNIDVLDRETLKGVTQIEGICHAAIMGEAGLKDRVALVPVDFDSALKGLKICWDMKAKILTKKRDEKPTHEAGKVDFLGRVAGTGGGNAATEEENSGVVLRPVFGDK